MLECDVESGRFCCKRSVAGSGNWETCKEITKETVSAAKHRDHKKKKHPHDDENNDSSDQDNDDESAIHDDNSESPKRGVRHDADSDDE